MEENNAITPSQDTQISSLPEETFSPEVTALKEQIRRMEENHAVEMQKMQIEQETKYALVKMGAKNPALTAKVLDLSAVTVDKDGVHGLHEQLDKLRLSDPYLFHTPSDKGKFATGTSHGASFSDPENMTDAEYYRFVRRF